MIVLEQLQKIGLNKNQAKVYISLLSRGSQFLQELSLNTGIKRTTLYLVIEQMTEQDLLDIEINKKRKKYFIKDPRFLLRQLKEQHYLLDALMPELSDVYSNKSAGSKLKFFDTEAGLKATLREITSLDSSEELLTIESDIRKSLNIGYDFWKEILAQKKKRGIKSRTIIPSNEKDEFIIRDHDIKIRTSSYLNNFKISLYLAGGKTIIMIPEDSLCIIIENQKITKSLVILFEIVWRRSKAYFKGE